MNIINLRSKKFVISIMIIISANYSLANIHDQVKYDPFKGKIIVTESNHPNRVRIFTADDLGEQEFREIVEAIKKYEDNLRKFSQGGGANLSNERTRQQMEPINNRLSYDKLSYAERKALQNQMEVLKNKIQYVPEHMLTTADIIARINYAANVNASSQAFSAAEIAINRYNNDMNALEQQRINALMNSYENAKDPKYRFNYREVQNLIQESINQVKNLDRNGFSFAPLAMGSPEIAETSVKDPSKMRQSLTFSSENYQEFEAQKKSRTLLEFLQTDKFEGLNLDQVPQEPSSFKGKKRVSVDYIYELSEKILNNQEVTENEKALLEKILLNLPESSDRQRFFSLVYGYKIRKNLEKKFLDSISLVELRVLKMFILQVNSSRITSSGFDSHEFFQNNFFNILNARKISTLLPYLMEAIQKIQSPEGFVKEIIIPLSKISTLLKEKGFVDIFPDIADKNINIKQIKGVLGAQSELIVKEKQQLIDNSIKNPDEFRKSVEQMSKLYPALSKYVKQWATAVQSEKNIHGRIGYYSNPDIILANNLMNQRNLNSNPNVIMCLRNYK